MDEEAIDKMNEEEAIEKVDEENKLIGNWPDYSYIQDSDGRSRQS